MSDLLIRGIGMPIEKPIAVVINPDGTAYCAEMCAGVCTQYLNDCVAIPVQSHGGLIEKKTVFKLIQSMPFVDKLLPVEFMIALQEIPTVIPASKRRE